MKRLYLFVVLVLLIVFASLDWAGVWAVAERGRSPQPAVEFLDEENEASMSAGEASLSAKEATPASIVEKVIEEKEVITEPTSEIKGKLERYLAEHPLESLGITNFLQHAIRQAVKEGVPANTIVLILLFPLAAAVIAMSRHLIGIRGFGIFLPAVLSVVFVATGIIQGLLLFLIIIIVATGARMFLRKAKLQYLPRMALLIWFVSLGVLAILFASPLLGLTSIATLSIFPILILILLAESFIGIQIGKSMKEAVRMTFETLVIALVCSFILQLKFLQKFVLIQPELAVLAIAIFDIFVGRYTGLRLMEYKKFKGIMKG